MRTRILLAATLLALSSGPAIADTESPSQAKAPETGSSQDTVVAEGAQSAADSKSTATDSANKDSKENKESKTKTKSSKAPAVVKQKEEKSPKSSGAKTSAKASNNRIAATGNFLASGSKRMAALLTGFAIGTPIAAVRMTIHEDGEEAKCLPFLSESSLPPLQWASRLIFIPSAVFSGTVQAPISSATNAWRESADNPFSKESIFLGNYEERASQL